MDDERRAGRGLRAERQSVCPRQLLDVSFHQLKVITDQFMLREFVGVS